MKRLTTPAAIAATFLLLTTACSGGGGTDRSGGDTLVLEMATIDGYEFGTTGGFLTGPETFATVLREVSGGKMRVDVTENYGKGAPGAEAELVEAIAKGELDGGWPATRAFSAAGIRSLEAIEAPLTLSGETAVHQLITGDAGKAALDSLAGTGVTGLTLLYGGLRRPFADRMLLSPADWAGARMRVFGSPVQEATVTALGAKPVQAGTAWIDQVQRDELDGAEFGINLYEENGYGREVGNVPLNVVLWPKVFVLSLSSRRYDSLTDQQRAWVREATEQALRQARLATPTEASALAELCSRGVRFGTAAGRQLADLKAKVAPVVQTLADDPETAPLMKQVAAVAKENPLPDVLEKPADCAAAAQAGPPQTASDLPEGTWRVQIPVPAVADAGLDNGPGWSGTWTLKVEDGTFVLSCTPLDSVSKDCGNAGRPGTFEAGYLKGKGHAVHFVADEAVMRKAGACPDGCHVLPPYQADWQLDDDRLTFTADEGSHLTIRPWTRIG